MAPPYLAGQKLRAADMQTLTDTDTTTNTRLATLERLAGRGWYRRTSTSSGSASTTAVGVSRVNNIACVINKPVRLQVYCHPDSTVGTDNVKTDIRYSTAGSATASSTLVDDSESFGAATASHREYSVIFTPPSTGTYSFALTVSRGGGTGTVSLFVSLPGRSTRLSVEQFSDNASSGDDL
jgi:hypothetical protein